MKLLASFIAFLFFIESSYGLLINEIMADPIADESLNEWIELYNNNDTEINASNWIIGDETDNDTIEGGLYNKEGTIIKPFGYAIITDGSTRAYDNFNVSADAVRLYVDDSSIGNGLSNNGETLYLYNKLHVLIDKKAYNTTTEALSWSYINGSFFKKSPSPGFSNDGSIGEEKCDYSIGFILAKTAFDNSSEFSFQARVSKISGAATNFTANGKIEDFNGNIIQDYKFFTNDTITTQRTSSKYSPNLEEGKAYLLSSNLSVACTDIKDENNFNTEIVTIKGKSPENRSFVKIQKIYDLGNDDLARFGDIIRVGLNAYKGSTNKNIVSVWIEGEKGRKISRESKANLDLKYTNYSFVLPVQIKPNCNGAFDDSQYLIVAEGLGVKDEKKIEIEGLTGSMCGLEIQESSKSQAKPFIFEIKEFKEKIEVGTTFKTKVLLENSNKEYINVKIWSYIYRGSKSYSGEREDNKKEIVLKANSVETVELKNSIENAEPGMYKLKVAVNKNSQKTNSEITKDIEIISGQKLNAFSQKIPDKSISVQNRQLSGSKVSGNTIANAVIYESTTEKSKGLVLLLLAVFSIMLNIVLIWRR